MEAAVESVDHKPGAGLHVRGWARDPGGAAPAIVRISAAGALLAESRAALFRADLLRRGLGHGHYGFLARLRRPLPAGPTEAMLHLPRSGETMPVRLDLPAAPEPGQFTVEALLHTEPGWMVSDLVAAPGSLALGGSLAAMGPRRFLDMLFRFALRRWPAAHEAGLYAGLLEQGMAPDDLLVELLTSRERGDLDPALVSPWHPEFPFPPG